MYINTWREDAKKTEPGSFQWCPVTGNRHKLKQRRFHLNIREHFSCKGDQALAQVAQRDCAVSHFGDIQKPSGHGTGQVATGGPAWGGVLDQMTSRGPLPTSTTLWFYEKSVNNSFLGCSGFKPDFQIVGLAALFQDRKFCLQLLKARKHY